MNGLPIHPYLSEILKRNVIKNARKVNKKKLIEKNLLKKTHVNHATVGHVHRKEIK